MSVERATRHHVTPLQPILADRTRLRTHVKMPATRAAVPITTGPTTLVPTIVARTIPGSKRQLARLRALRANAFDKRMLHGRKIAASNQQTGRATTRPSNALARHVSKRLRAANRREPRRQGLSDLVQNRLVQNRLAQRQRAPRHRSVAARPSALSANRAKIVAGTESAKNTKRYSSSASPSRSASFRISAATKATQTAENTACPTSMNGRYALIARA